MRFTLSSAARLVGNAAIWLSCGGLGFACSSNDIGSERATSASLVGASGSAGAAHSSAGGSAAVTGEGSSDGADLGNSLDFEAAVGGQDDGEPLGCGLGPGSVDQQQLEATGTIAISASQLPGQSFRLGRSGVLAGLELGLASCNGVDPEASIQLTLSRAGHVIATASIPATRLPPGPCDGGIGLGERLLGPGFFDFTGQCVSVSAGESLTATLSIVGSTAQCAANERCTSGARAGLACKTTRDCEYSAQASETGEAHDVGTEVVNGEADESTDLAFKVFVR